MIEIIHGSKCAYAGLPLSQRGQLPWPAGEGDMCICDRPASDFPIVEYLRENSAVDFEYVSLGGTRRAGDPPRYFLADYRDGNGYYNPWVCVHQWTASPASLLRNIQWTAGRYRQFDKVGHLWVFEARNKSQCRVWLDYQGYSTDSNKAATMPRTYPYEPAQERIIVIVNNRDRKMAQEQAIIERAQARIDRLASLPAEPATEDPDGALVVWFRHRFNMGSREYTYAAVKASDGLWYTTGPASPKGYSWDELIEWHMSEVNIDATMWVATEWEPIA